MPGGALLDPSAISIRPQMSDEFFILIASSKFKEKVPGDASSLAQGELVA